MSAGQIAILTVGVTLAATVTEGQAVTAAGAVASAAGRAVGFAQSGGTSGMRIGATALGIAKAVAGGAVAVDALVEVNASGQVVTKSAGVAVGRALSASTNAGDEIEILVIPN